MNSATLGRVAALTLTLGLLGLAGCNRPAADSPTPSSNTSDTSRSTSTMPERSASTPMPSASGARP